MDYMLAAAIALLVLAAGLSVLTIHFARRTYRALTELSNAESGLGPSRP